MTKFLDDYRAKEKEKRDAKAKALAERNSNAAEEEGEEAEPEEETEEAEELVELEPEERAAAGLFLAFQYPVELPGVNNTHFLKEALNAQRRNRGEEELDSVRFMKLVREKMELVSMKPELLKRPVNAGFSGGEKKRNEILQLTLFEPRLARELHRPVFQDGSGVVFGFYRKETALVAQDEKEQAHKLLIEQAGLPPHGRLLDIATGTGDIAFEALRRRPDLGPDMDPKAFEERRQRAQLLGVVVVSGDDHGRDALGEKAGQEVVDQLLRLGGRGRGVEDVVF